jgi:hypothetical protein
MRPDPLTQCIPVPKTTASLSRRQDTRESSIESGGTAHYPQGTGALLVPSKPSSFH